MSNTWKTEAEAILRDALAADLGERPLYILTQAEAARSSPAGCHGFTTAVLDLVAQSQLESQGVWRGRGPCIAVNDSSIREWCESNGCPERFTTRCVCVAIHEICHCLEFESNSKLSPAAGESEAADLIAAYSYARELYRPDEWRREQEQEEAAAPPWYNHEAVFFRAVIHAQHRIETAGHNIAASRISDTAQYGLSPMWRYVVALGREPWERQSEPITAILKSDPPREFAELWERDTRKDH